MDQDPHPESLVLDRRGLFKGGAGLLAASGGVAALLAGCGGDDDEEEAATPVPTPAETPPPEGEAIVGDVLDFALRSDEWEGAFGFVTMRLHQGVVDGEDAWFIRTDSSDERFARSENLVFAPRIAPLATHELSGELFLFDDGPAVLSSSPGRDDYTPAWRVRRATWRGQPRQIASVVELRAAERRGDLTVQDTGAVMNAPVVKWSGGQLGVDGKLRTYLEGGQLIEPPDTGAGEVKFKLHECFPNSRYIVTDHSIAPAAEMTKTALAPGLHAKPREAEATGRTNVFMNGLKGPGPMEAQPSVFDSDPGDSVWSPYWDHFTFAWTADARVRVLRTERQVFAARDAGELREFPGTPDTKGEVFTVNCPVPVTAPATFRA
jgi:hypothetical protein